MRTLLPLLLLVAASSADAANTYYVDANATIETGSCATAAGECNDTCAGTVASGTGSNGPWCTLPGTRTTGGGAYLRSAWGSITSSAKVACGDLILLKGGTTHSSGEGGAWLISDDSTGFYTGSCTGTDGTSTTNRITIRVATSGEWSESSGDFTLAGNGISEVDGDQGPRGGLIVVDDVDSLTIGGISDTQRLNITGDTPHGDGGCSGKEGIVIQGSGFSETGTANGYRMRVQWVDVSGMSGYGFNTALVDDWIVTDSLFHDNHQGLGTGGFGGFRTSNGGFVRVVATNNGEASPNDSGCADNWLMTGAQGIWCVDCVAEDNYSRGADSGEVSNFDENTWTMWRNARFDNNGRRNDPAPNFGMSGDDNPGAGTSHNNYFVGLITYRAHSYGSLIYGAAGGEFWHAVWYRNGHDGSEFEMNFAQNDGSSCVEFARVVNSIVQTTDTDVEAWGMWGCGASNCCTTPVSRHNIYRPTTNDSSDVLSMYNIVDGVCGGDGTNCTDRTFAQGTAWLPGTNDKIISHSGCGGTCTFSNTDPGWSHGADCDASPWDLAACDFTPSATGAAVDAGQTLFVTASAQNSTTIYLANNGTQSNDPRFYFISPDSYQDAVGDSIRIGDCIRTIVSMTSTDIVVDSACDYASGVGVHLASFWAGSAPDIGAEEYRACHGDRY